MGVQRAMNMVNKVNSDLYSMPEFYKKDKLQHSINAKISKKLLSFLTCFKFRLYISK